MLKQLELFPPISDKVRESASRDERAQEEPATTSIARSVRAPTTPVEGDKDSQQTHGQITQLFDLWVEIIEEHYWNTSQ